MRKTLFAALAAITMAGCTTAERDAVTGGAIGATAGALISGDVGGALVGGAVGAAAGVLIGRATNRGECVYRDRRGQRYVARCPAGY
jgi:ABC-type branched-subunit amino acid transport system permease subunit